jgi:hypothetical protein
VCDPTEAIAFPLPCPLAAWRIAKLFLDRAADCKVYKKFLIGMLAPFDLM